MDGHEAKCVVIDLISPLVPFPPNVDLPDAICQLIEWKLSLISTRKQF